MKNASKNILIILCAFMFLLLPANAERSNTNWVPYKNTLNQKFWPNFANPRGVNTHKQVSAVCKIARNGQVVSTTITSSGNSSLDTAFTDAVKRMSPFPPLPSEFNKQYVFVELKFDLNISNEASKRDRIAIFVHEPF